MTNPEKVKQFGQRLLTVYTGSMLTQMIDIGYRTGLFEASSQGPASSEELSERAGLHERYVREWLGAMTTGGIYRYDPETRRYTLPAEHAALLTGGSARNLGPIGLFITQLGTHVPALAKCFRGGDGLGAVMGQQTAREMLAGAGFRDIIVEDTPRPQNYMLLCRP